MSKNKFTRKGFFQTLGAAGSGLFLAPSILTSKNSPLARKSGIILEENAKPGTTDWVLTKVRQGPDEYHHAGWFVRREIQGYASDLSVKAGETLKFYVSTEPADEYKLEIFRMGYYGGKGGRLIRTYSPLQGRTQPMPEDGPNNRIECQWDEAVSLKVPDDWVSGVYLGKLSTFNTEMDAYIIFIVRDEREADLLFQCSDFTWIAYNRWPKYRSLYDTPEGHWNEGGNNFDAGISRPYGIYWNVLPAGFEPQSNGSGEFLMWEFPLAFWLEKEGYDVTYISNLDVHRHGPDFLRRAKAFLSVGHDEYWTQEMYDNVTKARDAGLSLAFLSGNAVSGRIAVLPGADGTPYRGAISKRGGFRSEQELMGSRSYGVGFGDWTCMKPDHWVFEGTKMSKGESIPNLVGWEYHGYPLAETHDDLVVLAEGGLSRGGRDIKDRKYASTIYTADKGNIVFNAATCWWNMVLSAPPGFVKPLYQAHDIRPDAPYYPPDSDAVERPLRYDFHKGDERVRRITKNVLDHMLAVNIE